MRARYTIVEVFGMDNFIRVVNDNMDSGWRPIGGVIQTKIDYFAQAMVLEENSRGKKSA